MGKGKAGKGQLEIKGDTPTGTYELGEPKYTKERKGNTRREKGRFGKSSIPLKPLSGNALKAEKRADEVWLSMEERSYFLAEKNYLNKRKNFILTERD